MHVFLRRREALANGDSEASHSPRGSPLKEISRGANKLRRLPRFNLYREFLLIVATPVAILPLILPFVAITSDVIPTRNLRSESMNALHLKHEEIARSFISVDNSSRESVEEPGREDSVKGNNKGTANEYNLTNMDMSEVDWESFGFSDLYYDLECKAHARNPHKPLFTPEMWALMRKTYRELAEHNATIFRPDNKKGTGYYSEIADGKGQGAFAARDFKEGELVHDGNFNTAFWNDARAWKKYIISLPQPMACDVMEWTWTQEIGDKGWFLCLSLNDATFMNNGWEEDSNIATKNETTLEFYALRDIKKDEELLYNYDLYDNNWKVFGL